MTMITGTPVEVPRLNANEDQVLVVRVHVADGDRVEPGDVMLEVETTKATAEVTAPAAGIVGDLAVREGAFVDVGVPLCRLSKRDLQAPSRDRGDVEREGPRKVTAKARKRAAELGVDLDRVPGRDRIGVGDVEALALTTGRRGAAPIDRSEPRALVFGGGGHAAVVVDTLMGQGYRVVGCIDDHPHARGAEVLSGVKVLGDRSLLADLKRDGVVFAFVGIGGATSNASRAQVFDLLSDLGFLLPFLIHPRAHVSGSSIIGAGSLVLPGAVVGPRARIGRNVIVNQGAQICHDAVIGDGCHVTPGAMIAGSCRIGPASTIGMGATVLFETTIGSGCLIHNKSAINSAVPDATEVFGDGRRATVRA